MRNRPVQSRSQGAGAAIRSRHDIRSGLPGKAGGEPRSGGVSGRPERAIGCRAGLRQ